MDKRIVIVYVTPHLYNSNLMEVLAVLGMFGSLLSLE